MNFILNTGRTIRQGSYVERKNTPQYQEEASTLYMHEMDMLDQEIESGDHVQVLSAHGAVVMRVLPAAWLSQGVVFVCLGPYANHLVGSETHCTGMPDYKDTVVRISPTDAPLVSVADLMEQCGGVRYEG
ncbi:formylmethanofuran dehydrogenase (tungsten) subunit d [hydrocarbon metagenome]|uniref:Formylmethanofuran dehydrogenase (Tungsten) subunit d n=1 Tax=hydrocarbon metagenome TaxID=938273 RepID=A0A0W8F145_9ZZZZ